MTDLQYFFASFGVSFLAFLVLVSLLILILRVSQLTKAATIYFRKESNRLQLLDIMSRQIDHQQRDIRNIKDAVAVLVGACSPYCELTSEEKDIKLKHAISKYNLAEWLSKD